MTTVVYKAVLEQAQQLSPEEQSRLIDELEGLSAIRAYDAAVAAQTDEELVPLDQAIAEIEAEWVDAGHR